MALGVSGINANGRVSASGAVTITGGILIPKESAGIGDLIYKNGTSNYVVIGRGTATGSTVTVGSTTYTLWGCIYGFVSGMAMVVAPNGRETNSIQWCTNSTVTPPSGMNTSYGSPLMRNGNSHTCAQMNTAANANPTSGGYIYKSGEAENVILSSAYQSTGVAGKSAFDSLAASHAIKQKYGDWDEYVRQTLRVNGAPGTPFGASYPAGKVKVHEFGRWATHLLYNQSSTLYPAAAYCYEYTGALANDQVGTWWLPSMFELAELMIDDHLSKVNDNSSVLSVSAGVVRWSSVLVSASNAWGYDNYGMSNYYGVTLSDTWLYARPVTLLKLV